MDLDALLRHYFDTDDFDAIDAMTRTLGQERLALDFGVEQEPGRRFALWTLMEALGIAPPPAEAFKDVRLQRAADAYRSAAWRIDRD